MVKEIPLTQGKVALIDDEDYGRVSKYKWYAIRNLKNPNYWYAARSGNYVINKLHHFIMKARNRFDHIDGNGLNNTRSNLREATQIQNSWNRRKPRQLHRGKETSPFKGVSKATCKQEWWYSRLVHNYKEYYLGCFKTQEEAARAYDRKAVELFGEYAKLNFPSAPSVGAKP